MCVKINNIININNDNVCVMCNNIIINIIISNIVCVCVCIIIIIIIIIINIDKYYY